MLDKASISEAQQHFLDELSGSPRTVETYANALEAFARCLQEEYPTVAAVSNLPEDILSGFFVWLEHSYSSRATRATYLAAIRRFLTWLDANDWLAESFQLSKATSKLSAARGKRQHGAYQHRPVDPGIPLIVTYYDGLPLPPGESLPERRRRLILLRNRALVHTLYASGGRVSEIVSLTRAGVFDGRAKHVLITGKGGRDRMLLLTLEAQRAIQAYVSEREDDQPALFISHGRGRQPRSLNRKTAWKIVKDAAKALGLHEITSPHSFRHYRATQLLNEGMPLESVQAYLGHVSIETTRLVYAHTHTAVLEDQLDTYGRSAQDAARDL
jgi:site-specific recombinase XerD